LQNNEIFPALAQEYNWHHCHTFLVQVHTLCPEDCHRWSFHITAKCTDIQWQKILWLSEVLNKSSKINEWNTAKDLLSGSPNIVSIQTA
jgi:hypothetical protein